MASQPNSAAGTRERSTTVAAVGAILVVGWCLSIAASIWSWRANDAEGNLQFARRADRLTAEIQRRVTLPGYGLQGILALYKASQSVTREEFRAYVESRNLEAEFPGAIGFGLIERVMRSDLPAYIARERADNAPGYDVYPDGDSEDLYPIRYIDPLVQNRAAWGYDVGSEKRRRTAVEKAVRTGEATMTARIDLVQDSFNLSGFLYLLPMYKPGTDPKTPEERVRDLEGVICAPIIIEYAFAGIASYTENLLQFDVFDGRNPSDKEQLFDFDTHLTAITGLDIEPDDAVGRYALFQEVEVGGRVWTIHMASTSVFDATIDRSTPALIGFGGFLLTIALAVVIWSLANSRVRALRLATSMTRDLAEAKARADAANQSKSEFLANMSHEIRTPLTAILGYASILRDEGDLSKAPPRRIQAVNTIFAGGEHLLRVINDILDLSKIEAGKATFEAIEMALMPILADLESLMRPRAAEKGVELSTRFTSPVPDRIISDPTRLRQILMNLVGNAAKFTETGTIEIRVGQTRCDAERVLYLEIEDTGPGMTPEESAELFDPFTQADNSVTRKFGGTGLGLAISRRLAQVLGGDVLLVRSEPGVGSVFRFETPLRPAPGATDVDSFEIMEPTDENAIPEQSESLPALNGRILLAEDNPVNQRLIQFHLTKAGATVELAGDGVEALDRISNDGAYALLLTDMQMPEMDGYTLAATLREQNNAIPIIAITAHAMAEDRQKCISAGCNDYITKPIDKRALIETCKKWIESRGVE